MWTAAELTAGAPTLLPVDGTWVASASHNGEAARNAFGFGTWTSGTAQQAGMWFQFEMPEPAMIAEVAFQSAGPGRGGGRGGRGAAPEPAVDPSMLIGFPRAYTVQVSMDGSTWSVPVAQGTGSGSPTAITLNPVRAKFVRITQTAAASDAPAWSIQRLRVYQAPAAAR
jgi:hypothetical protein